MTDLLFFVDIGNTIKGRTLEIEAYKSRDAYNQAKKELKEDERVIQVRGIDQHLYYSCWQEHMTFDLKFSDD